MLIKSIGQPNSYHKKKHQWKRDFDYHFSSTPQAHSYTRQLQHNSIQNFSIQKPLEVQPTFKGFYNSGLKNLFVATTEDLSPSLSKFTFSKLEKLSEKQFKTYTDIVSNFVENVKDKKSSFNKVAKFSSDWTEKISKDSLPQLPKKSQVRKFLETIISPITSLINLYKPIVRSKIGKKLFPKLNAKLLEEKKHASLIEEYRGFLGLNNAIKSWENAYRKYSGNAPWQEGEEFLIPEDLLLSNIRSARPKVVDPNKGKYSTKSLMLGNRLTSGMIYSVFLATDAYNTTMKFSGNKEDSTKQQKSRFAQENSRIALNLYLQNVIFSTFESQMNKSLVNALLASGATVALSEIAGRQMVSKPIMPSDKASLDAKEQEMRTKKGVVPAIGRMLTGAKKSEKADKADKVQNKTSTQNKNTNPFADKNMPKSFGSFSSENNINNKNNKTADKPSFTGFEKTAQMFESKNLKKLLDLVKDLDSSNYEYYKSVIERSLKIKSLDEVMEKTETVQIGQKMTTQGKIAHSVFAPYYWVKNSIQSISKKAKEFAPVKKNQEMLDFVRKNKMDDEFKNYLESRLNMPAWQKSKFSTEEKKSRILEEFVNGKNKTAQEVQGVQNVLLWLEKQIKTKKLDIDNLTPEQKKVLDESFKKAMILSDSAKHLEYDGNTLAQLNIHLARVITTIFLVTDAYNLTMQYSNDNKKSSQESAKARAVQEITRISLSAYMLGFIHNLMSRVCNSGLAGAFTVTAVTSIINDALARKIVGVPLTPKTQEQLLEKDKKKNKK